MSDEAQVPAKQSEMKTGGAIQAFVPRNYEEAWRIATTIVKAGMAPNGLETNEKAMVAIMHGQEVGFTPMAALQSIAVIHGRPTIFGDGALGLVQGSGKMEWIKEFMEGEGDARKAVCEVKRKGDVEVKRGEFSVVDAKEAGLWGKAGPWKQYAARMLKMRARSWALRDGFSDVLKGLGIAEEVQDIPESIPHKVVGTEPLVGRGAEVSEGPKLPGVKAASAGEAVVGATPEPTATDPGPKVDYLDHVVKVHSAEDRAADKTKYAIQTKTLGAKKLLGTYDEALVAIAKRALADGTPVGISYDQEEGKKAVLVSIALVQ